MKLFPKKKILLFDHHECHALYGYYSNNIDLNSKKTVIVTSDEGGDGTYETVSTVEKGKYRLVSKGRGNLIGVIDATYKVLTSELYELFKYLYESLNL